MLSFDGLLDLYHETKQRPVAWVVSRRVYYRIQEIAIPRKDGSVGPILGVPIHALPDIPDNEIVAFNSHKVLAEYVRLRQTLGHTAALQRMKAFVDQKLIIIATLRAEKDKQ